MGCKRSILLSVAALAAVLCSPTAGFASILGAADDFAVLAGSTVTNTGSSTVVGDIGVSPGSAITGYGSITHTGTLHLANAAALAAQNSVTTAFNGLAAMTPFTVLSGDLGGMVLTSGVYRYSSSAQLTGTLQLDAQGNNNAYWVFQIGSTLTTAGSAVVQVINPGSNNTCDDGLFWQVGTSATLGGSTAFQGNILADQSITLVTGATILNGRALARIAAVTMDTNTISNRSIACPAPDEGHGLSGGLVFDGQGNIVPVGPSQSSPVPEPSTMLLFGLGGAASAFMKRKRKALTC